MSASWSQSRVSAVAGVRDQRNARVAFWTRNGGDNGDAGDECTCHVDVVCTTSSAGSSQHARTVSVRCLLLCMGQTWQPLRLPVMTCRLFLRKLRMELKIPVLALVDSDPYGLKILAVYMKGVVHLVPTLRLHPWPWFLST